MPTKLKYNNLSKDANYTDKHLEASISYPNKKYDCRLDALIGTISCKHFNLSIKNQSNTTFKINWNKSYYMHNEQSQGGVILQELDIKMQTT